MRLNYTVLAVLCLLASVPLVVFLMGRRLAGEAPPVVRIACFDSALSRPRPDELLEELRGGKSEQAKKIAEIVQRSEPDVLLLCGLDAAVATAKVFADEYLAVGQDRQRPIRFDFVFAGEVNTGVPTGLDLDRDGRTDGPGDSQGFGAFPGQHGMALLSRHPIATDRIRTFQRLPWSAMPGALRPPDWYADDAWSRLRLSTTSHWDVPIRVLGREIHLLCSQPTAPGSDGAEDRNGCRNHDEIRFWVDYLTPGAGAWIVDDAGVSGGLADDAHFVLLGDLNCDPADGDGRRDALLALLAHGRVQDLAPRSAGGAEQSKLQWGVNAAHKGDPALDTSDFPDAPGGGPGSGSGNLRLDYVLPARTLMAPHAGVFWPQAWEPTKVLVAASAHRLVWVDVGFPPKTN